MSFPSEFLDRQQAYYDARAPEYDDWWERRGRYARDPESDAAWFQERALVEGALAKLQPHGRWVEFACGTGNWTRLLARSADHITALDGSAKMLAIHTRRLPDLPIARRQVDLFEWTPDTRYDGAAACFWLSHVPAERLLPFLCRVRAALHPGAPLFLVDSRREPLGAPENQPLAAEGEVIAERVLNDGRRFEIVKIYYAPADLAATLAQAGFTADLQETDRFFLYGVALAR